MKESEVFKQQRINGLVTEKSYRFDCDDRGHSGNAYLSVFIAKDGDIHVSMKSLIDEYNSDSPVSPFPSVRCRVPFIGGGRYPRTHQALLWLAQAIRLDNKENNI